MIGEQTLPPLTFASNNGDIGGGEIVLLQLAEVARRAGWQVHVVGPGADNGVLAKAAAQGHSVTALARDRQVYVRELRRWDRQRDGLLWCNGLAPAVATAGRQGRVVHLHQVPAGWQVAAARVARASARRTVVPSAFMARHLRGATVLPNWNPSRRPAEPLVRREDDSSIRTVGYIGRLTSEKGLPELCQALASLIAEGFDLRLLVAGEARFASRSSWAPVAAALGSLGTAVELLGWVAPEDFYGRVDTVVVPSRCPESFGLTVTEAMASRVPVVVTDAGALPELVGPDHPWLARAGDPNSLRAVLHELLVGQVSVRQQSVEAAHQRWEAHYAPRVGESVFEHLLADLAHGGGSRP